MHARVPAYLLPECLHFSIGNSNWIFPIMDKLYFLHLLPEYNTRWMTSLNSILERYNVVSQQQVRLWWSFLTFTMKRVRWKWWGSWMLRRRAHEFRTNASQWYTTCSVVCLHGVQGERRSAAEGNGSLTWQGWGRQCRSLFTIGGTWYPPTETGAFGFQWGDKSIGKDPPGSRSSAPSSAEWRRLPACRSIRSQGGSSEVDYYPPSPGTSQELEGDGQR